MIEGPPVVLGREDRRAHVLIGRLAHRTPSIAEPLDLGAWRLPAGLRPGLRTFLPRGVKNWLRVARERI